MAEIVIGYDGSDCSRRALGSAADLAGALGDSLRIVFGYAPGGVGGGEVRAQREAVEELGAGVVAEAERLLAERPGAPAVAVIGHDVWRVRFGGDPNVVGRVVRLGRTPTTVVGVMP